MSKTTAIIGFIARAAIAGLAIAFLVIYLWPSLADHLATQKTEPEHTETTAAHSYADAVNRAAPSVVSVYTRSIGPPHALDPRLQEKLGFRYLYRLTQDMGSGVIISQDGYILTNHHVISGVQDIWVSLWDGRVADARVVGSDPATDLAVLKVDLTGLPVAPIADDPEIRVGDVVLAIGNALGFSHTVTMGIVSATGRSFQRSLLYEDFIQTDAAINAGNSGGALVNASGDLIGINTRNLDSAEGAQNIGFAIPITLARKVMRQIIDYGSVRRGWLGATFSDLRMTTLPDGTATRRGVGVVDVVKGGPAWNAGIRQGDVIMKLDDELVTNANQFILDISQRDPGSKVELEVLRRGESFQTYATLIQQPPLQ